MMCTKKHLRTVYATKTFRDGARRTGRSSPADSPTRPAGRSSRDHRRAQSFVRRFTARRRRPAGDRVCPSSPAGVDPRRSDATVRSTRGNHVGVCRRDLSFRSGPFRSPRRGRKDPERKKCPRRPFTTTTIIRTI